MPATREKIGEFLTSDLWTPSEKFVIKWQFRLLGDFHGALIDCIKRADERNMERLAEGFPTEVDGFRQWAYGDLGTRLREAGLEI
jgi:hypothetical protein